LALIFLNFFISEKLTQGFALKAYQAVCEGCDTTRNETGLKQHAVRMLLEITQQSVVLQQGCENVRTLMEF